MSHYSKMNYYSFLLTLDWFSLPSFLMFNIEIVVQYITLFNVMVLANGRKGEALKLH